MHTELQPCLQLVPQPLIVSSTLFLRMLPTGTEAKPKAVAAA
jgi:hypothetical protein